MCLVLVQGLLANVLDAVTLLSLLVVEENISFDVLEAAALCHDEDAVVDEQYVLASFNIRASVVPLKTQTHL